MKGIKLSNIGTDMLTPYVLTRPLRHPHSCVFSKEKGTKTYHPHYHEDTSKHIIPHRQEYSLR